MTLLSAPPAFGRAEQAALPEGSFRMTDAWPGRLLERRVAIKRINKQQSYQKRAPMKTTATCLALSVALAGSLWAAPDTTPQPITNTPLSHELTEWARQARQAAERAMQEAREAMAAAQEKLAQAPQLLAQSVGAIRRERGRHLPVRPIRTLVVSPRLAEAKQLADMEEDLAVMLRLLAKDIEFEVRPEANRAMGIVITSLADHQRAPEAMYLEGFGAFFYLTVDFPLLPEKEEKSAKADAAPMDSDWDRARAELFGGAVPETTRRSQAWVAGGEPPAPPAYEAEKVEDLKRVLLNTLRHAVNLRGMKPEDWVHVAVSAFPRGSGGIGDGAVSMGQVSVTTMVDGKPVTRQYASGAAGAARQGLLNLRVKRSDLDDYAKGKLTLEDLRKKAQITLY